MRGSTITAALALTLLSACTGSEVVRGQGASQAEADCTASGIAPGTAFYQDCVEALRRGRAYASPAANRSELDSLFYRACVDANHPPVGCGCLVTELKSQGLDDRGMRTLLVQAGAIWQPPGTGLINVTPIDVSTRLCHLRFP